MHGAHMVMDPAHERGVDEVGGDDEELRMVELHSYDTRDSIVSEPDLRMQSDLRATICLRNVISPHRRQS